MRLLRSLLLGLLALSLVACESFPREAAAGPSASSHLQKILASGELRRSFDPAAAGYTPTGDDVFVTTFPKRGTNWGNIEYDTQHSFFLQYIRAGDENCFFLGHDTEIHNRDIDTVHWSPDGKSVGGVYVHQMCHVGDYYTKSVPGTLGFPRGGFTVSHAWVEGHFDHYFLTGDRRSYGSRQTINDDLCPNRGPKDALADRKHPTDDHFEVLVVDVLALAAVDRLDLRQQVVDLELTAFDEVRHQLVALEHGYVVGGPDPAQQREIVYLHVFDGCSFSEAGRAVGIPTFTAASRYRYALQKLREILEDKVGGGWAGQMIGVSYGAPYEFRYNGRIQEDPIRPWKPEHVAGGLTQDDLYVEMTWLSALEKHGLDITPEQARRFEEYVREGNGLIWFAGDNVEAGVWNKRSALERTPLLPAVIEHAPAAAARRQTSRGFSMRFKKPEATEASAGVVEELWPPVMP